MARESSGAAALCLAVLVALGTLAWSWPTFTGSGADMAHHYALVYWIYHHWALPRDGNPALSAMASYPPGSHAVAAIVGHVFGSPFRGMQLVAIAALAAVWIAIASLVLLLPLRRAVAATTLVAVVLVFDVAHGPLRVQVHGYEIVGNFFFAQLAGQAVVWWVVWLCARDQIAGRSWVRPTAATAVLAVLTTWIHLLASVELLVLLGCLCAIEVVTRWRTGLRRWLDYAVPVAAAPVTALAVVATPGYRAMQSLAANNGALDVPYLSGLQDYLAVAGIVTTVSAILLMSFAREPDRRTACVMRMLAFVGFAISLPCFAQAVALSLGSGSPYAVKKYIYGLLTILVLDAAVALSLAIRRNAGTAPALASWRAAGAIAVSVLATLSTLSHPGGDYSMGALIGLERAVGAIAAADHVSGGRAYAISLPGNDPWLDYMFSISILDTPAAQAENGILGGDTSQLKSFPEFVTAAGATATCARRDAETGLNVVDARCSAAGATACRPHNVLGIADITIDPRLQGFSRPDPDGRWTSGTTASFTCEFRRRPRKAITVEMYATAFVPHGVPRQRVTLRVGSRSVTHTYTQSEAQGVVRITLRHNPSRRLRIDLSLPDAVSPASVGYNGDTRVLALNVHEIRIR